ncbi:MAG TPA: DapH/DapD/GlmU-related protein [Ottowia sp.]|uniref:gamma carbonic anhydrase family protein n=1 Tax=Ottowia sp. TaxID=1898956 RepID=UPI002BC3C2FC|nr:DapH/DapD/GlmU-related protein [Ottowia sp.]HMN21184.1 DapH/DapD/GlmU-related protein [Ottowia sp.]
MRLSYLNYLPRLEGSSAIGAHALVIGRVRAGPGLTLGEYATVRADGEAVDLGQDVFLGERATIHIVHDVYGTRVGDRATIGRYALVHGCTLGDEVVLGPGSTVMDGAVVGARALLLPDTIVPPRKTLEGEHVYAGNPARAVRPLAAGELARWHQALRRGAVPAQAPAGAMPLGPVVVPARPADLHRPVATFVAATAGCGGTIELADEGAIYFACVIDAGAGRIAIGRGSNIQDNSLLRVSGASGELVIGDDVTVGHNVRIGSGSIGDRALIGMASVLADGVVVEAGACVGAGAWVEPGARIESGWIWAGRPARPFREIRKREGDGFLDIISIYKEYSEFYRHQQDG